MFICAQARPRWDPHRNAMWDGKVGFWPIGFYAPLLPRHAWLLCLDCCHFRWNKCPTVWQGSFKGKEDYATIVLEAISDYNLWFWHGSFGHSGSFNDTSILDSSALLHQLTDGSFGRVEEASGKVLFYVNRTEFNWLFIRTDGIYPKYSRFVKTLRKTVCFLAGEHQEGH